MKWFCWHKWTKWKGPFYDGPDYVKTKLCKRCNKVKVKKVKFYP